MKQIVNVKVKPKAGKRAVIDKAVQQKHSHFCLNCGHHLSGNYCIHCGQSAHTHRLTIRHFIVHDLVHSLWHVDQGIFFALKEVLIRPGYSALDFISGKRKGRFPVLTLLLILLGLIAWVNSFGPQDELPIRITNDGSNQDNAMKLIKYMFAFIEHNTKWILLATLPISALATLVIFQRSPLNYTEHLLVNSYVFGGTLVIALVVSILEVTIPSIAGFVSTTAGYAGTALYIMGYWQAFHKNYSTLRFSWRIVLLAMLDILLILVVIILCVIVATYVLQLKFHRS